MSSITFNSFGIKHDDMLGEVRSSIAGATQWDLAQINDTGFLIGWLKNNSSDFFQIKIQVPHRRYLGQPLDSIHFHYILEDASLLNQTVLFTGSYCWVQPGDVIPANTAWTAFSGAGLTLTLPVRSAFYYGIHSIQSNIAAPSPEGYGGMLLIKITRGNGTYTGRFGILDCDAHTPVNRLGSTNEASE